MGKKKIGHISKWVFDVVVSQLGDTGERGQLSKRAKCHLDRWKGKTEVIKAELTKRSRWAAWTT